MFRHNWHGTSLTVSFLRSSQHFLLALLHIAQGGDELPAQCTITRSAMHCVRFAEENSEAATRSIVKSAVFSFSRYLSEAPQIWQVNSRQKVAAREFMANLHRTLERADSWPTSSSLIQPRASKTMHSIVFVLTLARPWPRLLLRIYLQAQPTVIWVSMII
jgi:hypothetical protein